VVGGVTRSELRVAHALAARTGRDITLGSTSIETPASFLQRVQVRPQGLRAPWPALITGQPPDCGKPASVLQHAQPGPRPGSKCVTCMWEPCLTVRGFASHVLTTGWARRMPGPERSHPVTLCWFRC